MFGLMMKWMQANKILPQISDTERQALEAGTVWIDGEFFGGNPDFSKMLAEPYTKLSAEEQAFLDGPVEELLPDDRPLGDRAHPRIPEHIIEFVKKNGFMGLLSRRNTAAWSSRRCGISTSWPRSSPYSITVGTWS